MGLGAIIGGAGQVIGAATGFKNLLGLSGGNWEDQMEQQFQNEKEMMGLQNQYNQAMAQANHERNKQMWDYTNFENQRAHLEKANLSVGLMYGNGGAGGTSTAGGQGSGPGNPGTNAVGMGLQAKALELQNKQIESQIALNMATAEKTASEAKKIAGVDTKQAEANTENLIQATNNEKIRRGLILANIRYQDAMEELTRNQADAKKLEFGQITQSIKNLEKAWEQLDVNIQGIKMDNKVKKETVETMVKQAQANLQKTMAEILTERTKGQVNAATINDITSKINTRAEQMTQQWRRIKIEGGNYELNKTKFEIEADKMYQQLDLERWRLNNEEKRIVKDYIMGILQSGVQMFKH
nr:MAG TPA: hypothetical protein [Microviridae sp.]